MLENLLTLSPWVLVLGIAISLISVIEAFATGKTGKERSLKCLSALLAISLLLIQAHINRRSAADSKTELDNALNKQQQQITSTLTTAFKTGSDQIILLSQKQADKAREAANSQTNAIEKQASLHLSEMKGSMLGSTLCPQVVAEISRPSGRPKSLTIFNLDPKKNMYDISLAITEWGPSTHGSLWSTVLQTKTISIPLAPPERGVPVPFKFLSEMNVIDLQLEVITRSITCDGRLDLYDTGGNVWVNDDIVMGVRGGSPKRTGEHRSPGLSASQRGPSQN